MAAKGNAGGGWLRTRCDGFRPGPPPLFLSDMLCAVARHSSIGGAAHRWLESGGGDWNAAVAPSLLIALLLSRISGSRSLLLWRCRRQVRPWRRQWRSGRRWHCFADGDERLSLSVDRFLSFFSAVLNCRADQKLGKENTQGKYFLG
nr:hypothetical protein Itr_chr12CG14770 [Ipomoea trifida]